MLFVVGECCMATTVVRVLFLVCVVAFMCTCGAACCCCLCLCYFALFLCVSMWSVVGVVVDGGVSMWSVVGVVL